MSGFDKEAKAFLIQYDRLGFEHKSSFADFPDAAQVRIVIPLAEWIYCQHNNPLMPFSTWQKLVIALAGAFLRWCSDPGNPERWQTMIELRVDIDEEDGWIKDY
jgi:hypothetical protein